MTALTQKMVGSMNMFSFSKASELKSRILFLLFILVIYRIGTYIPLPGINPSALSDLANVHAGGVLGMFNMFTGGAIGRMSIFALNIMPYITASIIMQLMTVISSEIANLKKDGELGRKKINQYTRYLTVLLALLQGYGIATGVEAMTSNGGAIVLNGGYFFRFSTALTLMGGTLFVMWLGEQITAKGIGNGSSIIIFAGIVSGLPSAIVTFFEMGRSATLSVFMILLISCIVLSLIFLIVFVEKAQRRILVQYPRKQVGNKIYAGDTTHLPLKVNTAGVIPPIFASSLLLMPQTLTAFSDTQDLGGWKYWIAANLSHGQPLYMILYIAMICFFSFFYTSIIFNPEETSDNLRKNGGVVLGRRPGTHTAQYFDYILTRLTVVGALYMSMICVVPELLVSSYSIPFYLGGTSLLIVVNVTLDFFTQVQTYLLASQYDNLLKKNKLKGRL